MVYLIPNQNRQLKHFGNRKIADVIKMFNNIAVR